MNFTDPFTGYSLLLRVIVYGLIPAFGVWQVFRLRRALHVFQLEGYKRRRFLQWCRDNRRRALFLKSYPQKKPLVMTGRAWRLLAVSEIASVVLLLVLPALAHLYLGGWPADVMTCLIATAVVFVGTPHVVVASDVLLQPLQTAINKRYQRRALAKLEKIAPAVVGITGSFGKTSTKHAVAGLLDDSFATPGSFNTPMGVCRSINEGLEGHHRVFVVEMGAYREGDIAELCSFVRPKIGVLTAVGPAHLKRFGSIDAIRRAKYELIESLPPQGVAVMNVDDAVVRDLADATDHVRVVRYGTDPDGRPDVTAAGIRFGPRGTIFELIVDGAAQPVQTRLLGHHAIGHVLAGAAVATSVGVPPEEIARRAARLEPVEHRLQLIEGTGGVAVIDDAYNSNPAGAAAALDVLAAMPGGRKVVVTPGIVELGELQESANEELGRHAGRVADLLVVVAPLNRAAIVRGAQDAGKAEVVAVDSLAAAQEVLRERLRPGDVVLFENDLPDQYEG